MRIVAGLWRGRTLAAPPGATTRPTADRVRQALFDMLAHAPWAAPLAGATVLDAFAGTGALGLEALSRGAAHATFLESDRPTLLTLRANIAACHAEQRTTALHADATHPPAGHPCAFVFLDPPYGRTLIPPTITALAGSGWIAPEATLVAETARDEPLDLPAALLATRAHGAARVTVWRF